jgi:uracil-DNA glycosylase family 4
MNQKKSKSLLLQQLYSPFKDCVSCPLSIRTKHNVVCGHGNPNAQLMFIGEAPGKHEDEQGIPFVGKSGMLLTKALASLDIDREKDVFITNSVKCRPPQNRKPTPQESKAYKNLLLLKEIEIIKPTVICTLGATALECLLEIPVKMSDLRGKKMSFDGIILIPTYHPAYILRGSQNFEPWFKDLEKAWNLAQN